ncbi:MAG TPA: hypothetical protein VLT36_04475 [Candidatus Dormibacteraeota bacterium]|nr:hypothetical protein [Candidatus Dormibacteraeota bacterium]
MKREKIRVTAPIYLLRSTEACWRCHAVQAVVALAFRWKLDPSRKVSDQPGEGETVLLKNIHRLPPEVQTCINALHPAFKKQPSRTSGTEYFMNTCECGAHFGDYYLFSKPGGAFFPMDQEQQKRISREKLHLSGDFEFGASEGIFSEDLSSPPPP